MTDTRKRVARVKLSLTKRTVEALRPADRPWIAWDDKLPRQKILRSRDVLTIAS